MLRSINQLSGSLANLLALVGALLMCAPAAAEDFASPRAPLPIYTRENVFRVPFFMDPVEPGARRAVEVQLHVSENGGPWKLYAKAPPANGSFLFRATRDGEYRFLIRTKDDRAELHPSGPPAPELIVILDTDPPVLELLADRGTQGEIHARWRVRDAHLRVDSLHLEYQIGPDGPVLPVAIDLPPIGATTSAREATWLPEARAVPVTVLAEVSDLAGNVAKRQMQVVGFKPPRDPNAKKNQEADRPSEAEVGAAWPAERTQRTPLGSGAVPSMSQSFPGQMPAGSRGLAGGGGGFQPPAEEVSPREMLAQGETLPAPEGKPLVAQPSGDRALAIPDRPEEVPLPETIRGPHQQTPRTRRDVEASDGPRLPWLTSGPAGAEAAPLPSAVHAKEKTATADAIAAFPTGVEPRMSTTRRIELAYDVESIDPAGVRRVEIWGTRDTGRTWTNFGTDDDQRSHAVITVDSDGLYGFRLVVESASGMRDEPPKSGDEPDAWIAVDTQRPAGRITGVELGSGAQAGTVVIRWEAEDALLAARPISLFFSPQPNGPWSPIGMDLEDSGEHVWRPDAQLPERVYVRLEVRDRAGNLQAIDTPQPTSLRALRPRGRIREVHSAKDEAAANPQPVWREYQR